MKKIRLTSICSPKQWRTIPTKDLLDEGYPVYGANGVIGYCKEYNHTSDTIIIGCRGSCGNVNIARGKSYINGNAMCLDDLSSDVDILYLYYFLQNYDFRSVISGTTIPQVTKQGLEKIDVVVSSKENQREIVRQLQLLDSIIEERHKELRYFDALIKSRFIEMFGDPVTNPLRWAMLPLEKCLTVLGGYAFKSEEFKTSGVPVLRIGNINTGAFTPTNMVYWSKDDCLTRYQVLPGDLVISLTGTVGKDDYGNVCILGNAYPMYYLNQRNAKLILDDELNKHYLSELLKFSQIKKKLTGISRGVRQANISNRDILNLVVPIPPIEIQVQFAAFVEQADKSKFYIVQMQILLRLLIRAIQQKTTEVLL